MAGLPARRGVPSLPPPLPGPPRPPHCSATHNAPRCARRTWEDSKVDLVLDVVGHLLAALLVHAAHAAPEEGHGPPAISWSAGTGRAHIAWGWHSKGVASARLPARRSRRHTAVALAVHDVCPSAPTARQPCCRLTLDRAGSCASWWSPRLRAQTARAPGLQHTRRTEQEAASCRRVSTDGAQQVGHRRAWRGACARAGARQRRCLSSATGARAHTCCHQPADVGHVCQQPGLVGVRDGAHARVVVVACVRRGACSTSTSTSTSHTCQRPMRAQAPSRALLPSCGRAREQAPAAGGSWLIPACATTPRASKPHPPR
jgi:hypothetical protein